MPTVSVVIPCFNQGRFLAEAVRSVLGQTWGRPEVIIVDDGSIDSTTEAASCFGDAVRCIRQENRGVDVARNVGILASHGEFLHFLDADDHVSANFLEAAVGKASATGADVCHGEVLFVNGEGSPLHHVPAREVGPEPLHSVLSLNPFAGIHSLLIRRTAFARAGIFDPALGYCEDWDMWIRLAAAGCTFQSVQGAVAYYRTYPQSRSNHTGEMWRQGSAMLEKNGRFHKDCSACRAAVREGREALRDLCYRPARGQIFPKVPGTALTERLRAALRAGVADPRVVPKILREAAWRTRDFLLGRAG